MNYIREYYELIKSGELVTSKKIKKVFDIIINDLDNPKEYHFDIDRANRPIEFIEKFCYQSKGQWIGKPIKLALFQKAITQAVFGFVDKDGVRKYREVLILVGRKNGKSTWLSALALYMMTKDGEGGAEIACIASKKDQAKIVFDESKKMVRQSTSLKKYISIRKSDMYMENNFSTFAPLASDSNTLDGLNLHAGIIDELHSIKDRNIYDVTKQSMSARMQPMLFIISTAGFNRETIYDEEYEYADKWLDGNIIDDRFIAFVYELDSRSEWTNEDCWIKANPGLDVIKSRRSLKEYVERAKIESNFLPTVLTKDFNIRESGISSWLTFEAVQNESVYDFKDFTTRYAVGGCDLSSVGDLTCGSLLWRVNDCLYLAQMYFIPKETAYKKQHEDNVPYLTWEEKGWIRFSEGNRVEYHDVTKWFVEMRDVYGVYPLFIGYDRWSAQYWITDMISKGFVMEEVIQGAKTMSNPMKILSTDLEAKKINYNNNPILRWCLTNTQIETDKNENIRPVKAKSAKQRIDGTVSLIDAYVVYQSHYDDFINMTKE